MKYQVHTDVTKDGVIIQTLLQDLNDEVARWLCDTRDTHIIEALIKLGWTPPDNQSIRPDDAEANCEVCGLPVRECLKKIVEHLSGG